MKLLPAQFCHVLVGNAFHRVTQFRLANNALQFVQNGLLECTPPGFAALAFRLAEQQ
ncbi:MAG: hypothetical protein ACRC9V_01295 [Aeromonas sp.]